MTDAAGLRTASPIRAGLRLFVHVSIRLPRWKPCTLRAEDPAGAQTPREAGREMATAELKSALQTASEIELTVTGRRSGRDISNPVWFVQEGEKLYLLPVGGSESDWYRTS